MPHEQHFHSASSVPQTSSFVTLVFIRNQHKYWLLVVALTYLSEFRRNRRVYWPLTCVLLSLRFMYFTKNEKTGSYIWFLSFFFFICIYAWFCSFFFPDVCLGVYYSHQWWHGGWSWRLISALSPSLQFLGPASPPPGPPAASEKYISCHFYHHHWGLIFLVWINVGTFAQGNHLCLSLTQTDTSIRDTSACRPVQPQTKDAHVTEIKTLTLSFIS